jgi:regulator of protease activity HflC (stomatin/prohibitin superfamily)
LTELKQAVRDNYGIEIKTLGIKQLKVSEDVSRDVFERMRAERNRRTEATISEGNAEATKIRTNANSIKTELLAAAKARQCSCERLKPSKKYWRKEQPLFSVLRRTLSDC